MKIIAFSTMVVLLLTTSLITIAKPLSKDSVPTIDSIPIVVPDTLLIKKTIDSLNALNSSIQKQSDFLSTQRTDSLKLEKSIKALSSIKSTKQTIIDSLDKELRIIKNNILSSKDTIQKLKSESSAVINSLQDSINEIKTDLAKLKRDSVALAQKDSALMKAIDSTKKTLESQMATIAKQKDSLEVIAQIDMRDEVLIRFKKDSTIYINGKRKDSIIKKDLFTAKINQINIKVREGIITEIVVITDSGTYRNENSIIDLLHFEKRGGDKLYYVNQKYIPGGKNRYIYLDDAIEYSPLRSYADLPYADFDITLLPPNDKSYLLKESTSINTYFNVAAFTDIKGISGEPNGIAQFTGDAKFIFNTKNFCNTAFVPFNYISFHGALSKFDNNFKGAELIKNDSISRKDLFQRSNYAVGVKLNILRNFSPPTPLFLFNNLEINLGYNFIGTRIFDTSFKDDAHTVIDTTFTNVTQNQWYIEPNVTFSRHGNFSMCVTLPFYFNSIKQSANIKNYGLEYWASPGICLMYYSKRDSGSKLFFRYNHFINLKDKTQAFSQMQLGYSLNLTDIWNQNQTNK